MSINKFIKNYKKPTKSYFEFKKDKEKIFENFEVELEKENTKKFKAKRLKITLSLILLLILSIGAIIVVNGLFSNDTPGGIVDGGDTFKGVELTEEELDSIIKLCNTSNNGGGFIDISFNGSILQIKHDGFSYYEIEKRKNDQVFYCGYLPLEYIDEEMLDLWRSLIFNGYGSMAEIINGKKVDLEYNKIKWYKFYSMGEINEKINDDYFLFYTYLSYTIEVKKDVLNDIEVDIELESYYSCLFEFEKEKFKVIETNDSIEDGKYIYFGKIFEKENGEKTWGGGGLTKKYQWYRYVRLLERDNNIYLYEKVGSNGNMSLMESKYDESYVLFEDCVLEIYSDNLYDYAIYDYCEYINTFKNIIKGESNG